MLDEHFTITPHAGVDRFLFGMDRGDVISLLEAEVVKPFKRGAETVAPSDYLPRLGVFFYYDAAMCLEAIEFSAPASPLLGTFHFLGQGFNVVRGHLSTLDPDATANIDGIISQALGISLWVPLGKNDATAPVESLLAFKPGYYDRRA